MVDHVFSRLMKKGYSRNIGHPWLKWSDPLSLEHHAAGVFLHSCTSELLHSLVNEIYKGSPKQVRLSVRETSYCQSNSWGLVISPRGSFV